LRYAAGRCWRLTRSNPRPASCVRASHLKWSTPLDRVPPDYWAHTVRPMVETPTHPMNLVSAGRADFGMVSARTGQINGRPANRAATFSN
jgi:hypothetical protein